MKIISIIIPVYNVEKYISKCIESVLKQDLNEEDYEIIIVDDESPDNSVEIINTYTSKYSQIRLIRQKNKGLGGARNTGINEAKGKYLLFLDADDYLNQNILKKITAIACNNKLDILEFGAIGISENNKIVYTKSLESKIVLNGYSYLNKFQYMNSACNKLYQTRFLRKNSLFFKERIYIEDFEFNTRAFYFAQKVMAVQNIVSYFVQSPNSITRNSDKNKNLKMVNDIQEVIFDTIDFKNDNILSLFQQKVIDERLAFLTTTLLYKMFEYNFESHIILNSIKRLKEKGIYPINFRINDNKKNMFKYIVNNQIVYFSLLKIKKLL